MAGASAERAGSAFNVTPGSYTLTVTSGGGRPRDGGDAEIGSMPLTVGSEDLEGITIVTGKGATLSGTIAAALGATGQLAPNGIQVNVQPIGLPRGFQGRPGRSSADGTFQLSSLFGQGI